MRNSEVNKKNLFSHNLGNFGQNAHKLLTLVGGEPLLSELLQILQYNVLSSALWTSFKLEYDAYPPHSGCVHFPQPRHLKTPFFPSCLKQTGHLFFPISNLNKAMSFQTINTTTSDTSDMNIKTTIYQNLCPLICPFLAFDTPNHSLHTVISSHRDKFSYIFWQNYSLKAHYSFSFNLHEDCDCIPNYTTQYLRSSMKEKFI